jgi:hypothetical protein
MKFLAIFLILSVYTNSVGSTEINGFLNLRFAQHDHRNSNKLFYNGIEENAKLNNNSAGIAFTYQISDNLSSKVQIITDKYNQNDFEADIYQLVYDFNSKIKFRMGRLRSDTWLYSEVIQIGVLYPWISTPVEVYGKNPLDAFIGGAATYTHQLASDMNFSLDVMMGHENRKIISDTGNEIDVNARDITGMNLSFYNNNLLARISYLKTFIDGEILTSKTITISGTPVSVKIPSDFDLKNVSFTSYGLKYDKNDWLLLFEQVHTKTENEAYEISNARYITIGYFMLDRKYLLHFTQSEDLQRNATAYPSKEKTIALGLNYEINSNIILKSEFKKLMVTEVQSSFSGVATSNSQNTNYYPDRDINIIGIGLAIVF